MRHVSTTSTSVWAYAPGRVELLGNHTDYNGGVVLAGAIDRGITVSGKRRKNGRIVLHSNTLSRRFEGSLADIVPQSDEPWANYPLGVVKEFLAAGLSIEGFEAEISGNLPLGGGLSSSAALEVATANFLLKLYGLQLPPMEVAKLCQRAENNFVGVRSGLLDQATSVFGRADHAVFLDFRTEWIRTIPFPHGLALVIADSGAKHSLVQGEYNERREQCHAAAQTLGANFLCEITTEQLMAAPLDPLVRRRALHVVGENERVWRAVQLLAEGDSLGFGDLMTASHESSRVNFENSTPDLDLLVEIASSLPGVLGARLTGGGFGGSTITLVEATNASLVAEELSRLYRERSKNIPQVFICRLADGAH